MAILFGTDFSAKAADAAEVAAALAVRLQEPLVLLHSLESADAKGSADEKPTLRETTAKLLNKEAERIQQKVQADALRNAGKTGSPAGHGDLAIVQKVAVGLAEDALVDFALQHNVHLVIVSSEGWKIPSSWLLGSVSERTAEASLAPVLVVHSCESFQSWLREERSLRVLVGIDSSPTSQAALRWVGQLGRLGAIDLVLANISWPPDERRRLGLSGPMNLVDPDPETEKTLRRDLTFMADRFLGKNQADIRILAGFGRIGDHLIQLAEQEKTDLLVVGTHQRHGLSRLWHGSVSRDILHKATMSVACVPARATEPSKSPSIPAVRSVLAVTDFSELGNWGVGYAYSMLAEGGKVHLMHVVPEGSEELLPTETLVQQLRALVPKEATSKNIETEPTLVAGKNVPETICSSAERLAVDLICLGSHGRSGIGKALLGSVAQTVLTLARRPVLVIKAPF